jgi:hypothetical protein
MINKSCFIIFLSVVGYNNLLFTCHYETAKDTVHGVHVSCDLPIIYKDTSLELKHSFDVFYEDNLVLYKLNYEFDSSYNGKIVFHETRYYYFIFEKDSLFGWTYDFQNLASQRGNQRLPVDSMLRVNTFQLTEAKMLARIKPDSVYFDGNGDFLKVYNTGADSTTPEKFTNIFYYSKNIKGISETFSPAMDTIPNMKLFKINIKGHGAYYKQYNFNMPERVYRYEMDTVTPQDPETLRYYFNKYSGR